MSLETGRLEPAEYFSGESGALTKGERGKTSFLVGCFVPVILYQEAVIVGHFGPGRTVEARSQLLTHCLGLNNPFQVIVYRMDLTSFNFWNARAQEYENHYLEMKKIVAEVASTPAEKILERSYPNYSKILVDWTKGDLPNISVYPARV